MKIQLFSLLILRFALLSTDAVAQDETWYEGKIVLTNNQQLQGKVCYSWDGEVVQLRLTDGRIRAFSAAQVSFFTVHDGMSPVRLFTALPLSVGQQKQSSRANQFVFLEEYLSGPLPVMRRLKVRKSLWGIKSRKPVSVVNTQEFYPEHDAYDYFVYDGSTFRDLAYYYRDIEPLMVSHQRELTEFALKHKLNTRLTTVQLMLVNRYNQLTSKNAEVAAAP